MKKYFSFFAIIFLFTGMVHSAALLEQEASQQLIQAAEDGNVQEVKRLLQDPAFDVNAQDESGTTALIAAIPAEGRVSNNQMEVIELLLGNPNIKVDVKETTFGRTALMKAAEFGHKKIVQMLLVKEATSSLKDNEGNSARDLAQRYQHPEIVRILTPALVKSAAKR